MLTSRATLHAVATNGDETIAVAPSAHRKCERCWHWRADVGVDAGHPLLCGRCLSNLFGAGEARHFA
jgi:isoleucyl-tRNA synthetase